MGTKLWLGVALGLLPAGRGIAADAIPFFKPDPKPVMYGPPLPDPDVPSCAANDRACLAAHDAKALSTALAQKDVSQCDLSRTPASCRDVYEMITGTVGMKADPILDDPCSWVVLVDHGIAVIESKRRGVSHRYADRGWKPRTFLGKCDLSKLPSHAGEATVPLPDWVAPPAAATIPAAIKPAPIPAPAPEKTTPAPSPQSAPGAFTRASTTEP
ncbi:MAG TPA: hypothetical protein VHU40_23035 [Polyangia bacterium]|nr:hypothetical protein [Polyangia bacterium]